jgi:hypothetical protein
MALTCLFHAIEDREIAAKTAHVLEEIGYAVRLDDLGEMMEGPRDQRGPMHFSGRITDERFLHPDTTFYLSVRADLVRIGLADEIKAACVYFRLGDSAPEWNLIRRLRAISVYVPPIYGKLSMEILALRGT